MESQQHPLHPYGGMPSGGAVPLTQVTKDTRALVIAFQAPQESLQKQLPPGENLHPDRTVHLSMYRVTDPFDTTHLEAYTVTYLAIEITGHDSTVVSENEGEIVYPGRYFSRYWVSSADIASFLRESRGVPARVGTTQWSYDDEVLTSTLVVNEQPVIRAQAAVEEGVVDRIRGHLNYYGRRQIPRPYGSIAELDQLIELPIPVLFDLHEADEESIDLTLPVEGYERGDLEPFRPTGTVSATYTDFTIPAYPTGYVIRDYVHEHSD